MLRVVTYFLLLVACSPGCWAQATSSQASAGPELKSVGIASVRNNSASTIIPTLMSATRAAAGITRVSVMPTKAQATASATPKDNGIQYHGGPILDDANGVNVYLIWYGDWSKDTAAQTIVTDFISHLGGSPYTTVNTTYYDMEPGPTGTNVVKDWVTTGIHYMGSTTDNYSRGSSIGDQDLATIIETPVLDGRLPADPNGVYFVITSADVIETSGFCTSYCAFHAYDSGAAAFNNVDTAVAFAGNPDQCPALCTQESVLPTPNNNVAGDGMVNMLAHETEESVSDPFGKGWYDVNFNENEDLCQWTFGKTYNLPNGAYANMKLGQRQYLIQQNWVNKNGGYCALKWDE
jgi:Phosphate-induced protein 1 conserved region